MAEFFDHLPEKLIRFVSAQPIFFTATATAQGRINLSPKGMDCFRVLDPRTVAYLDVTGSGNETHAHLVADGRITIMFNSFDRAALILRLYGRGVPVLPGDEAWPALARHFTLLPGTRQIFRIAVESVQTSCGYAVPLMALEKERDTLNQWNARLSAEEQAEYRQRNNATSIDGLPARLPPVGAMSG